MRDASTATREHRVLEGQTSDVPSPASEARSERKLEHSESEASTATSSGDGDTLSDSTQLLRLETISDKHARVVTGIMKATFYISIASIVIIVILKEGYHGGRGGFFVLNKNYEITQVVLGVVLLAVVDVPFAMWLYRLHVSTSLNREWSLRRRRAAQSAVARALAMNAILISYLVLNIAILSDPRHFCRTPVILEIAALVHKLGWDTFLLLLTIDGHGVCLRDDPKRPDAMVRDLPWRSHWKKLFLWVPLAGVAVWRAALGISRSHVLRITMLEGTCDWGSLIRCTTPAQVTVISALWALGGLLFCALYASYLVQAFRQLQNRLYQSFRIVNVLLQLQFRGHAALVIIWVLTVLCITLFGSDDCNNWATSYLGIIPLLLCTAPFTAVHIWMTQARIPSDGLVSPSFIVQQFAWTCHSKDRKIVRRREALKQCVSPEALHTMFCVESAIKLFFWSTMIYDFTEAEGHKFVNLPESVRVLMGEVEEAMALFALERRHLFYDRQLETKVLVAWNLNTILVCARGTSAKANFIQDAKFLQCAHPPERLFEGKQPRVHKGFLQTWTANGIRDRVLAHISALLSSAEDRDAVRVLTCGHSLGGAIATLAAIDIATEFDIAPSHITCYTFGCPRVGNHTFAAEYKKVVPDTWHVVNNQDVVVHGMKFFGWYKRNGNRVILDGKGGLVVRPSLLELSLLQNPFSRSLANHMLESYLNALLSVIHSQLDTHRRYADGIEGLLHLLKDVPIVRAALKEHAQAEGISIVDRLSGEEKGASTLTQLQGQSNLSSATMEFTRSQRNRVFEEAGLFAHAGGGSEEDDEGSEFGGAAGVAGGLHEPDEPSPPPAPLLPPARRPQRPLQEEYAGLNNPIWSACCHKALAFTHFSSMFGDAATGGPVSTGDSGSDVDCGGETRVSLRGKTACYQIPEEEEELSSGEGGTGGHRGRQCPWRCPLTAKAKYLPNGAHLSGTLLDVGAPPCMHTCRLGRPFGPNVCKKLPSCPEAQGLSPLGGAVVPVTVDALGVGDGPHVEGEWGRAGAEGVDVGAENKGRAAPCGCGQQEYVDWLGNSMRKHAARAAERVPTSSDERATARDVGCVAPVDTEEGGLQCAQGSGVVSRASGDVSRSAYESASESDAGAEFSTALSWSVVHQ